MGPMEIDDDKDDVTMAHAQLPPSPRVRYPCHTKRTEVIADRMASGMAAALQRRAAKKARLDARTTAVLVVSGMFIKVRLFLLCCRIMTIENCVAGEFGCALGYQWISIA